MTLAFIIALALACLLWPRRQPTPPVVVIVVQAGNQELPRIIEGSWTS